MTKFPEFIFEAVVLSVDYAKGTCSLSPLSPKFDSIIVDVPMPYYAGNGNSGVFCGLNQGSKVIAGVTSGEGQEFTVILGTLPKFNLYSNVFDQRRPTDTPSGTISYPQMVDGRVVIRGDNGSEIKLSELGELDFQTIGGAGYHLRRDGISSIVYSSAENIYTYTDAGKFISGSVKRTSAVRKNIFTKSSINESPLFMDLNFHKSSDTIGFFTGSIPLKRSYNKKKRNPEISETRFVINEFTTNSMFSGFDDEADRIAGTKQLFEKTDPKYGEIGNTLNLSKHELIEFIGGNVVDNSGSILDINYQKLSYGDPGNTTPKNNLKQSLETAKRISRRGIGAHIQLSTSKDSESSNLSTNNFIYSIDKEGLIKINVPASSDTGNIPFPSVVDFTNSTLSYAAPSRLEPIPVHLRDENGEPVLPSETELVVRQTGIRFDNSDSNPYFPSSNEENFGITDPIRVNTTKYHNMYSAAERLIANTIRSIHIPAQFVNEDEESEDLAVGKPFEIRQPDDSADLTGMFSAFSGLPTYMSVVGVEPGESAIYSGGDTTVAGVYYPDDEFNPAYSNSFTLSSTEDGFETNITDSSGSPKARIGGRSANLNFEGSIEMSVGKDHFDKKSLVVDTDGSLVAWFGKDKNNRSMIMQTDGEVLWNIGGSYSGDDLEDPEMNVGRFELRVNVVDKKFVSTKFTKVSGENLSTSDGGNPGSDSDYIISISENGMVIAGNKINTPMVIRNRGKILIESETDLVLKGTTVQVVETKGASKTDRSSGRD